MLESGRKKLNFELWQEDKRWYHGKNHSVSGQNNLLVSGYLLYSLKYTAVTICAFTNWPVMVTRVPPATGPYNGHTLTTDISLIRTTNTTTKIIGLKRDGRADTPLTAGTHGIYPRWAGQAELANVPGTSLHRRQPHPSLWCCTPSSSSTISQPELSYCTQLSTQHVWLSGVRLRRPDSLELATRWT